MNSFSIESALLILLPLVSAVISSWLTYSFTMKTKKNEAMIRFKEEKYANLVVLLQGFVGNTISADLKRRFLEEQYRAWLYSSDNVVKAINEMIQLLIDERGKQPNPEKGQKIIGNIILEMRKDLLGETNLTSNDFRYTDVFD